MKANEFKFLIEVHLELSEEELDFCILCSERHYDKRCVALSKPDGVLWFMKKQVENGVSERVICLRDIFTLIKTLEIHHLVSSNERTASLFFDLIKIRNKALRQTEHINGLGTANEEPSTPANAGSIARDLAGAGVEAFVLYKDGNKWCCVLPDFINIQESPAGFGDSMDEAHGDLLANIATNDH